LTKLRLFQWTQYERIFLFDSDMLIVKCMDAIFADTASVLALNANRTERMKADEGPQPTSYVFAGVSGQGGYDHPWPPRKGRGVNAGFILFQPSMDLFHHYMTVAAIEGRFDSKYPEQNLWNYVHRRGGNMPWAQLTTTWNVNWPTMNDYNNGVASLHAKFWDAEADIRDLLLRSRWKMEGSAEARDEMASLASIL
jgi:alpha-N-acetylglucosamine transferase